MLFNKKIWKINKLEQYYLLVNKQKFTPSKMCVDFVDFQNLFIKQQAKTILGVTFERFCFEAKNEGLWRQIVPFTGMESQW